MLFLLCFCTSSLFYLPYLTNALFCLSAFLPFPFPSSPRKPLPPISFPSPHLPPFSSPFPPRFMTHHTLHHGIEDSRDSMVLVFLQDVQDRPALCSCAGACCARIASSTGPCRGRRCPPSTRGSASSWAPPTKCSNFLHAIMLRSVLKMLLKSNPIYWSSAHILQILSQVQRIA